MDQGDLPEGGREVVQVAGRGVLLIHHEGELFAISSTCPHMGLPLQPARIDATCTLFCPWHRSAFDLRTGDVKEWAPWPPGIGPMLGRLSREKALPIYPVKAEDGAIWVSIGEA